jgi:hypothetical protein
MIPKHAYSVTPAKAAAQTEKKTTTLRGVICLHWVPAFAGMTA